MTYRVVIVDDEPLARQRLKRLLEEHKDFTCVAEAGDGQAAVDWFSQFQADLLLLDIQMPGLDGFETSRKLRDRGVDIPIVACTANTTDQIYQKCIDSGMNDYIAKPLKVDTIKKTLQRWL